MGDYSRWASVMAGILDYLGVPGWLANRDNAATTLDDEAEEWGIFLTAWHETIRDRAVTTKELLGLKEDVPHLHNGDLPSAKQLGHWLKARGPLLRGPQGHPCPRRAPEAEPVARREVRRHPVIPTYPQPAGKLRGSQSAGDLHVCGDAGFCGNGAYSPVCGSPSHTSPATRICIRHSQKNHSPIRQTQKTFRTYPQTPQNSRSGDMRVINNIPANIPAASPQNPAATNRGDRHVRTA